MTGLLFLIARLLHVGAPAHVLGLIQQLCTTTPHVLMDVASLALAAVPVGIAGVVMCTAVATWWRTTQLVSCIAADALPRLPVGVASAARRAGLRRSQVVAFECPDLIVFAHGFVRPSVLISTAVLEQLDDDELVAVLAHEAQHVRQRDPLRRVIADVLARGLFLFPVVSELRHHFVLASEIEADEAAMRRSTRESLAAAILKFTDAPRLATLPAITSQIGAVERIAHVVDPERPIPPMRASRASVVATSASVLALGGLMVLVSVLPSM